MNLESLLVYGLAAVGGWLLRHLGVGSAVKVPGVTPAAPTTPTDRSPVLTLLKTDLEPIIKAAIDAALKQAIDDVKGAVVPQAKT